MKYGPVAIHAIIASVILISAAASGDNGEYNVKEILEQAKDDGTKANTGGEDLDAVISRIDAMIALLDRLMMEKESVSSVAWERNIFNPRVKKPPVVLSSDPVEYKKDNTIRQEPVLTGIVISGEIALALFGDREVREGEMIGGMQVLRITVEKVVLMSERGEREIFIE